MILVWTTANPIYYSNVEWIYCLWRSFYDDYTVLHKGIDVPSAALQTHRIKARIIWVFGTYLDQTVEHACNEAGKIIRRAVSCLCKRQFYKLFLMLLWINNTYFRRARPNTAKLHTAGIYDYRDRRLSSLCLVRISTREADVIPWVIQDRGLRFSTLFIWNGQKRVYTLRFGPNTEF